MFQRIPDAVLIHIGGNVIRRGTGIWPGVAHGNPDPGKSKHLGIVAAIAKGDAVFPRKTQMIESFLKAVQLAAG